MKVKETPVREIELEGHKALQYHIECTTGLGNFLLNPVFPTTEYVKSYFDKVYKEKHRDEPQTLQSIENRLGKPARTLTWLRAPFAYLPWGDRFVAKGTRVDSYLEHFEAALKAKLQENPNLVAYIERERNQHLGNLQPAIDKLQLIFEEQNVKLSFIYNNAIKAIDIELEDEENVKTELLYIDFLEDAMTNFEEILKRNIGVGAPFSLFQDSIRLFNVLFRKQPMFANRIFAYDLPRIILNDDLGLDRMLTPLLILGWAVEPAAIYPKTPQHYKEITERLLKMHLSAQALRMKLGREDERNKKNKVRHANKEILTSQLTRSNEDGDEEYFEASIPSSEPSPAEESERREELEGLVEMLRFLTPRQQEVAKLYLQNLRQRKIAERLGVHETAISKHMKLIRERLKKLKKQ